MSVLVPTDTLSISWSPDGVVYTVVSPPPPPPPPSSGAQAAVDNWVSRIIAAGGSAPSQATQDAHKVFWNTLNNAGLLNGKCYGEGCTMSPDSVIAAITPFLKLGGYDSWINHGFVAADLNVNGLKGDGVGKYLDTGMYPAAWVGNYTTPMGMSIYVSEGNNNANEAEFGTADASYSDTMILQAAWGGAAYWDCPYQGGACRVTGPNSGFTGFLSANRNGNSDSRLFKASSTVTLMQVGSTNTNPTTGSPIATNNFVFAINYPGGRFYSSKRLSFAWSHFGLTQAEVGIFYNTVQALRVSLGGGFV